MIQLLIHERRDKNKITLSLSFMDKRGDVITKNRYYKKLPIFFTRTKYHYMGCSIHNSLLLVNDNLFFLHTHGRWYWKTHLIESLFWWFKLNKKLTMAKIRLNGVDYFTKQTGGISYSKWSPKAFVIGFFAGMFIAFSFAMGIVYVTFM